MCIMQMAPKMGHPSCITHNLSSSDTAKISDHGHLLRPQWAEMVRYRRITEFQDPPGHRFGARPRFASRAWCKEYNNRTMYYLWLPVTLTLGILHFSDSVIHSEYYMLSNFWLGYTLSHSELHLEYYINFWLSHTRNITHSSCPIHPLIYSCHMRGMSDINTTGIYQVWEGHFWYKHNRNISKITTYP
jgi:hypothetical protein